MLGLHADLDSLVGLDVEHEAVGLDLLLALVEEEPYADIAEALGIPVGTVKSRVFRATRFLREELARLGVRLC